MDRQQARSSIKKLNTSAASLDPSAVIDLYEIDVAEIALKELLYKNLNIVPVNQDTTFRFHNNLKLTQNSIFFGSPEEEYIAAPIRIEGFEVSTKGTLPRPTMSITSNEEGVHQFNLLKQYIRALDSLVGAKVTRTRTFAKYLPNSNFYAPDGSLLSIDQMVPDGHDPDSNAHFQPDIYYIDRKSGENKFNIEFELASALDLHQIKLPGRLVIQRTCPFIYRGEGCAFEYDANRNSTIFKDIDTAAYSVSLPTCAPPLANDRDELFSDITPDINYDPENYLTNTPQEWTEGRTYSKGTPVFIQVKKIRYYFVAKVDINSINVPPPNDNFWIADQCSKKISGCIIRWGESSYAVTQGGDKRNKSLPFGGFPGVTSAADSLR